METSKVAELDLASFDAADEAQMVVMLNGKPTGWVWTFAGPGHPKTIEQSTRMSRARLRETKAKEEARVNGRKWHAPEETPDETRAGNVNWVVERLLGWSPVKLDGQLTEFSEDKARELLSDRRKEGLLVQSLEFLADDASFTRRSAKT